MLQRIRNEDIAIRALILAAGLGTRLKPLTDKTPKCLIEVGDLTVIDRLLFQLREAGIEEIIVNTHWLHEQVVKHVGDKALIYYEPRLLNTSETVRRLSPWLASGDPNGDFLVINGDTLSNLDIKSFIEFHKSQNNAITEARDSLEGKNIGAYMIFGSVTQGFLTLGKLDEAIEVVIKMSGHQKVTFPSVFVQANIKWFDVGTQKGLKIARKYYVEKDKEVSNL